MAGPKMNAMRHHDTMFLTHRLAAAHLPLSLHVALTLGSTHSGPNDGRRYDRQLPGNPVRSCRHAHSLERASSQTRGALKARSTRRGFPLKLEPFRIIIIPHEERAQQRFSDGFALGPRVGS